MTDTAVLTRTDSATPIRNEPVQARSTARLAALLDAAAHVIDEIGYERLTTAMVAERAGASIGTVYRYFPDRIAVLQSLAARNAERIGEHAIAQLRDGGDGTLAFGLHGGLRRVHHGVPQRARLRGPPLRRRARPSAVRRRSRAARRSPTARPRPWSSASAWSTAPRPDSRCESVLTLADAIAADAFQRDPHGDPVILQHAMSAANSLLTEYFPHSSR